VFRSSRSAPRASDAATLAFAATARSSSLPVATSRYDPAAGSERWAIGAVGFRAQFATVRVVSVPLGTIRGRFGGGGLVYEWRRP
jgi:hypothetical protein